MKEVSSHLLWVNPKRKEVKNQLHQLILPTNTSVTSTHKNQQRSYTTLVSPSLKTKSTLKHSETSKRPLINSKEIQKYGITWVSQSCMWIKKLNRQSILVVNQTSTDRSMGSTSPSLKSTEVLANSRGSSSHKKVIHWLSCIGLSPKRKMITFKSFRETRQNW